jgi:hypothetical protein
MTLQDDRLKGAQCGEYAGNLYKTKYQDDFVTWLQVC